MKNWILVAGAALALGGCEAVSTPVETTPVVTTQQSVTTSTGSAVVTADGTPVTFSAISGGEAIPRVRQPVIVTQQVQQPTIVQQPVFQQPVVQQQFVQQPFIQQPIVQPQFVQQPITGQQMVTVNINGVPTQVPLASLQQGVVSAAPTTNFTTVPTTTVPVTTTSSVTTTTTGANINDLPLVHDGF